MYCNKYMSSSTYYETVVRQQSPDPVLTSYPDVSPYWGYVPWYIRPPVYFPPTPYPYGPWYGPPWYGPPLYGRDRKFGHHHRR